MISFESSFVAPADPDEAFRRLMDVERVALCVPGAEIEQRNDDGSYSGIMIVTFGPKRLKFRGKVTANFDSKALSGSLVGWGAAAMNSARLQAKTQFNVSPAPDKLRHSIVSINSHVEMSGALASLGQTAMVNLAGALLSQFEKNLAADFAGTADDLAARQKTLSATDLVRAAFTRKIS